MSSEVMKNTFLRRSLYIFSGTLPYGHLVNTATFLFSQQNAHKFSYKKTRKIQPPS